jgi:REP element-mobilizing transposase RayT
MARPLRDTDPNAIRLITSRTIEARLLMTPSKQMNQIIGGVLARYQEQFKIEIFAYCFLSNHFHLVCRAPERNVWHFMQSVKRELAKRCNRLRNREAPLWSRRYDDQVCLRPKDALNALLYATTNPVKHQLVEKPQHWPGIGCYQQLLNGKPREFEFISHTAKKIEERLAVLEERKVNKEAYTTTHRLTLTPLPKLAELLEGKSLKDRLLERTKELRAEQNNAPVFGKERILKQSALSTPRNVSKSPRPSCYTSCIEALKAFKETCKLIREAYCIASERFRRGLLDTVFPPETLKPPLLYTS